MSSTRTRSVYPEYAANPDGKGQRDPEMKQILRMDSLPTSVHKGHGQLVRARILARPCCSFCAQYILAGLVAGKPGGRAGGGRLSGVLLVIGVLQLAWA